MGETWEHNPNQDPHTPDEQPRKDEYMGNNDNTPEPDEQAGNTYPNNQFPFKQDDIEKRFEEIRRLVVQGASEAQTRIKRAVDNASAYFQQQTQPTPTPRPQQPDSVEEHHIRQLVNQWSIENWRVAKDLGNYMEVISWNTDEVWEASVQTRWEVRNLEVATEPYTGRTHFSPRPLLPIWDYELPDVVGLKPPSTRTRLEGMDEVVACTACNSTGHVFCSTCTGRGWVVCPDCKGRTKKRCGTCRGRGYIADWTVASKEKKGFFRKRAEGVASSVGNKVSDVFDAVKQQGVPIPNPIDTDPASKGPTIPCPDCINGEVDCTCGNGKRVCSACQGSRMSICNGCNGTGKLVRHREMSRTFELRSQTHFIGDSPIPPQQLMKANGELVYNAEVNELLHPAAPPERVPQDIWQATVAVANAEGQVNQGKSNIDKQSAARPTLQVVELVRIPYTVVHYRFSDEDYTLFIYDIEGQEKFYAERHPARWDRVERLFKAITADLIGPQQPSRENVPPIDHNAGYRVPVEVPPYNINEEDEDEPYNKPPQP